MCVGGWAWACVCVCLWIFVSLSPPLYTCALTLLCLLSPLSSLPTPSRFIFEQGETVDEMFILYSGRVQMGQWGVRVIINAALSYIYTCIYI